MQSKRGPIAMGFGLSVFLGLVVLALTVAPDSARAEQPVFAGASAQTPPDPAVVFPRQCAACHGSEGEGGVGPDLRTWHGTIEETAAIIAQGGRVMPAFSPTLNDDQIAIVAAYLDDLVGITTYGNYCAACHGTFGEGGVGPSLKTSTATDEERRAAITDGVGAMGGFGSVLTSEEIDALVRRTSGYAAVGATVFVHQCAPCHGPGGEGGSGPPLAGTGAEPEEMAAILESGFGGMPAFAATLEPGDVEGVVAFVAALDVAPTTTTTTTAPPATTTTTTTTATEDPAQGVAVYLAHCAACHGEDAEGALGPSLVTGYSPGVLEAVIHDGKGSMPGFRQLLSDPEIEALVAFIESLTDTDGGVTASPALGAEIYAQQCAACHGADGTGGIAKSLRTTPLSGAELRTAIEQGNATMPAFSRSLSPEEIGAVATHVEALKGAAPQAEPLLGGPAIYRQDCAACHGEQGEGGIGPRLWGTSLAVNEIIARVYGGHADGMPAFEGALDSSQVLEVAQYVQSFEASGDGGGGLGAGALSAIVAGGVLILGAGAAILWRRRRLRHS